MKRHDNVGSSRPVVPTVRKGHPCNICSILRRGPISPRVHRTLDFLLAAAVIAVPLAVDLHDDTATVLMLVLGGAATLLAIGTNLSTGIIRILPPVLDGVADIAATIVLIVAPFVLGFTDDTVATVLYVVIGAGGLGATLLTRFEPDLMPAARIAPDSPLSEPSPASTWRPSGGTPPWGSMTTRRCWLLWRATNVASASLVPTCGRGLHPRHRAPHRRRVGCRLIGAPYHAAGQD